MADTATMNALANEARRQEIRGKVQRLRGAAEQVGTFARDLSTTSGDIARRLASAEAELAAFESGAGPGITDSFGMRTTVDNFATEERTIGQAAAIDFIKANPECSTEEAVAAWTAGVAAWLPEGQPPTHSPEGLLQLYTRNLVAWGKIPEPTWDAFRGVVIATPKDDLLNL